MGGRTAWPLAAAAAALLMVVRPAWGQGGSDSNKLTQVTQILGKLSNFDTEYDFTELGMITGLCFAGFNLKTCQSVLPTDDSVFQAELSYYTITLQRPTQYCLACCGTSQKFVDTWNMRCPVDLFTAASTNVYGKEFRFGVKPTFLDATQVVVCPIKRSACQYNGNTLLGCAETDNTYLWGYKMQLDVLEYSDGLTFWRGVAGCSVDVIEKTVPMQVGDIWTEQIVMRYRPAPFKPLATWNLLFFLILAVSLGYPLLRWYRTARCLVCNRKLTLVPLPFKRCAYCLFLNADLPDPYLLEAIEAKGRRIIDADYRPALPWNKKIAKFFTRDLVKWARIARAVSSHYGGIGAAALRKRMGWAPRGAATTRQVAVAAGGDAVDDVEQPRSGQYLAMEEGGGGGDELKDGSEQRSNGSRRSRTKGQRGSATPSKGSREPSEANVSASGAGAGAGGGRGGKGKRARPPAPPPLRVQVGRDVDDGFDNKSVSSLGDQGAEAVAAAPVEAAAGAATPPRRPVVPGLLMGALARVRGGGKGSAPASARSAAAAAGAIVPVVDEEVSVLSQHTAVDKGSVLGGGSITSLVSGKTFFSYESLPSLPPFMKRFLDRNTKFEKFSNQHIISHIYPKHIILRAVMEDGRRHGILTEEEKQALRKTSTAVAKRKR